jgi:outer membrane protein assembly factor BamB
MLLKLGTDQPTAEVIWQGKSNGKSKPNPETPDNTDGLHSVMTTPVIKDGHIYGVCSYGQLRCLEVDTAKRIWADMRAVRGALTPEKVRASKEPASRGAWVERWAHAFIVEQGNRYWLFNEQGDLIIARLTPQGYEELDRAHLIEPTNNMARRPVVWMHPAFASKCIFVRNDKEIACYSLAAE